MTPFYIELKDTEGKKVLSIRRGISIFLSNVEVFDENDLLVGRFKQELFSIGGGFKVLDTNDQELCYLKGKWTSWDFRFLQDEKELAGVSKKWAGLGKEMFTSADNYMLSIAETVPKDSSSRLLIMASVMCIDMVLKE